MHMGVTVSVISGKGGTGKTSLPGHFHQYLQRADIQHLFFPCIVLMSVFHFTGKTFWPIPPP